MVAHAARSARPGAAVLPTWFDDKVDASATAHDSATFSAHPVADPERCRRSVREARALDDLTTAQQLDIDPAGIAVAVQDRKGDSFCTMGVTLQMRPQAREHMGDAGLPALRDTARYLRAIL